jgi:UDP:flavonoid glycosyltransferase YjiC (YdhE family)
VNAHRSFRVVIATVGSRGDVQPALAIAQELLKRGHVPVIAAPPNFAPWVQELGFEFASLGVDMQEMLAQNQGVMTGNPWRMLKELLRYFSEQPPLQVLQLKNICQGADALVYCGLAFFVAPSICESLALPGFGVLFTTCVLPAKAHVPPTLPWQGLPGWVNKLIWRIDRPVGNLLMRRRLNKARALIGLAPVVDLRTHVLDEHPPTLAVDELLFPPDPRWQGRYPYANFLFLEDPEPLDPELDAWLSDGEPPVYLGFGSMSGRGTDHIEHLMIDAVSATGRRCLVGAGWAGFGAGTMPAAWRLVTNAPHERLFPRTALVVHHGGSGTTAQALRAGIPQVLLPLMLDQFHHAHCLYLAGLAPRPIPMEKITAVGLTQAIQAALALPGEPRQQASARLKSSHGTAQIAERVEALFVN